MTGPSPRFRFRFRFALLLGVSLLLAGLAVRHHLLGSRRPAPQRPLAELLKVDGRFLLREATNQPFSGWVTEHYATGTRRSRSRVVDGRLHGLSEGWHTNGVRQIQEHFAAGLSEGLVTKWHPDGTKASEGTARAGKFEGVFRRWHPNGVLAEEISLVAGKPHGLSRSWFPSGSLKAEVTLEAGEVMKQQFWEDGEQPALAATNLNPDPP